MKLNRWDAAALTGLALLVIIVLAASWARWLDPILDSGRDLYIPEKLVSGKVLYRDFQYYYPPVAPYLLALGTLIVGSDLAGYTFIGIAIGITAMLALYFLVRGLAGTIAATVACAMFVTLSLTAATNWGSNFIFPYAHAATVGMMFLLLYLAFMARFLFRTQATRDWCIAIAFGILAAGSKLELATLFAVSLVYVIAIHRPPRKLVLGGFAAIAGSLTIACVAFSGSGWLWGNILLLTRQQRSIAFYANVQGTNHLASNALRSLLGAAIVIAFVLLLALLERRRSVALIVIALAVLSFYGGDDKFFRAWSILQLALIPFALRQLRSPLPFLLIASLLMSTRIFLNLTPDWYGFSLIIPLYALIVYVLFELLPSRGVYSKRVALAWLPLLAILMIRTQIQQRYIWSHCVYPVETSRGTYFDWSKDRAEIVQDFIRGAGGARSLVVIPESPTLNYFTRVDNPLSYQMFTPFISDMEWLERDMIAEFDAKKPEYLAFVSRPVGEFGYRGFGIDYNRALARYIGAHYRVARVWQRPRFSLVLMKRATP
jgi:dolichyl-phosphate-mannose-protein mannosyltransferase